MPPYLMAPASPEKGRAKAMVRGTVHTCPVPDILVFLVLLHLYSFTSEPEVQVHLMFGNHVR